MKTENTYFSKSILIRNKTLQKNAEKSGNVHIFLVITLFIVFTVFTYAPDYGWWISLLGSAIMLIVGRLAFGAEWRSKLGLAVPKREIAVAAVVCAVLGFVFALFIFRFMRGVLLYQNQPLNSR
jgi:phosphate/sulfate permease